jgi:hypothetical protein
MADGTWHYDANHENPDFQIRVPLGNGELAPTEHLSIDSPTKMLGLMTCPSGCSDGAFAQMMEKAQGWVARAIGRNLNCWHIWFLLERQLSPMVFFGIGCNMAPFDSLPECLQRQWWEILPCSGIRQTAPHLLRRMDSGFYGIGLPNPGVECFVAQMEKLLIHYGSKSGVGIYMQMSMEMFVTELGVSLQPFTASYLQYRDRITHCWLRSLWEKVQLFETWVEIAPLPMPFPRERDKWLMVAFESLGFSRDKLARLNWFRIHQQLLFLSDILDACGKLIDQRYWHRRDPEETWSTIFFGRENPPNRDLRLWRTGLAVVAPSGYVQVCLGNFT